MIPVAPEELHISHEAQLQEFSLKQWHFYDKVFRRWVVLFIGPFNEFKYEMELCKFHESTTLYDAKGMCIELNPENNDTNQNVTVMWLSEWEMATFVHELTHLVMMLFDQMGIPISMDNTETFAFYAEYWSTEIQRVRKRCPDGRPPKHAKL